MEQLSLFKEVNPGIDIQDPVLKKRLEALTLPDGFRSFSRPSKTGHHEIGIERDSHGRGGKPTLVALPGFCHGNWSYIKLIEALSGQRIEISAPSPYGEAQSNTLRKPIDEWKMADYVEPYTHYINERKNDVVLLGHSLGGLHAQLLAAQMRGAVKGLILVNSVKPSNLCHRLYPVAERDGVAFEPAKNLKWILEELFNGEFPEDIAWIIEHLNSSVGSNAVIDDYAGEHGFVDPQKITQPILEFSGTEDRGETTGTHGMLDSLRASELSGVIKGQRASISHFFSTVGHCPFAKKIDIQGGSHNSLILGEDVKAVADGIVEHYSMFY
ncbi:alpha/beta hydrolase [Candidatus Peregrinibacteria bacterium]|nr:alpha/beta hydrolase [Candidatus Peregrinibacteria bacterium]